MDMTLSAQELEQLAQSDLIFHLLTAAEREMFQQELGGEIQTGHPLFDRNYELVARREGRDDFLGLIRDAAKDEPQWFSVHLTWSFVRRGKPERLPWPSTFFYGSIDEYIIDNSSIDEGIGI